jgi:hypothetical protein
LKIVRRSNAAQSKLAETRGRRARGLKRETGDSRKGSPAASESDHTDAGGFFCGCWQNQRGVMEQLAGKPQIRWHLLARVALLLWAFFLISWVAQRVR